MRPITLFSWGYHGWGNHTPKLIKAVDAVEQSRGFEPPMFVDIRIRRSVRAAGFTGRAFEELLGSDRHRWMKSLGNKAVITQTGPWIQIADPQAANELLDLAIELSKRKQRVIFFCSCEFPKRRGIVNCHRAAVTELLMKAAAKREIKTKIVEWPGGKPSQIDLKLSAEDFAAAGRGRLMIPVGKRPDLAKFAGLAWGSVASLHHRNKTLHRIVGPATWTKDCWALSAIDWFFDPEMGNMDDKKKEAEFLRRFYGWN